MTVSLIENDIGGRVGICGRDDEFNIEHAKGEALAGPQEADAWDREEHMGLELRRKEIKYFSKLGVVIT